MQNEMMCTPSPAPLFLSLSLSFVSSDLFCRDINYMAFHNDVTPRKAGVAGSTGAVPLPKKENETDAALELEELEAKVIRYVVTRGIRLKMFFEDYDKMRKGYCTNTEFEKALNLAFGSFLSGKELTALASAYMVDDEFVGYRAFLDFCDSAFTKKGLMKVSF